MHDAIGFHNLNTGRNYTLEWYELVELFNCTFAHVLKNESVIWCNQGAGCIYDGLDVEHWKQNGTFVKVAEITGTVSYSDWQDLFSSLIVSLTLLHSEQPKLVSSAIGLTC